MTTRLPGEAYNLRVLFVDGQGGPAAPAATPTVTVTRDGVTVVPAVTVTGYGTGMYEVTFAIGPWPGSAILVAVTAVVDGSPVWAYDWFLVSDPTPPPPPATTTPAPESSTYFSGDSWVIPVPLPYVATGLALISRLVTVPGAQRVINLFGRLSPDGRTYTVTTQASTTAPVFAGTYAVTITRGDTGALVTSHPITVGR